MSDGTSFLTGRDYIKAIRVRYGCLYNQARCARGRGDHNKNCRHGCDTPQTLNHILQQCYATHTSRIKRHNIIVDYLHRILTALDNTVHKEPVFKINNSTLKPDLVIHNNDRTVLVDVQVINDHFLLSTAPQNKVNKYEVLRNELAGLRPGGYHGSTVTIN